ncbi:restriction endonuclease [Acinetobacter baumannii]|uniref:restriction endonuclease n=1 Tax=Acinetobacter baumannii TaxID=470 RepID=UPI0024477158|nr:restriction endonuclease [Acinetobacter baumannii]MDH2520670.1 restriction endonuclease [Acinetobacter baumannii]
MSKVPFKFTPPDNWQDFERLTRILFEDHFHASFMRYGRAGQDQKGVDIIGKIGNKNIVIQCKCRDSINSTKKISETEIESIVSRIDKEYDNHIEEIYILITLPNDIQSQNFVSKLNTKRKKNQAQIILWGWDEIVDRINTSDKARQFYGFNNTTSTFKTRKIIFILITIAIIICLIYVFLDKYKNKSIEDKNDKNQTNSYLKEVNNTIDKLETAYKECLTEASNNLFLTSYQLEQKCIKPISNNTLYLSKIKNKYASTVDSNVYEKTNLLIDYLEQQPRELYSTTQTTKNLEKQIIQDFEFSCYTTKNTDNKSEYIKNEIKTSYNFQMYSYFLNRDSILPIIQSIKNNISIIERKANNKNIPQNIINEANKLDSLLKSKSKFKYRDFPVSLSKVKALTENDINFQGKDELSTMIEEQEIISIYKLSLLVGLVNNPIIVDRLISCGAMRPEIKQHIKNELKIESIRLPLNTN